MAVLPLYRSAPSVDIHSRMCLFVMSARKHIASKIGSQFGMLDEEL
jgi:hypothetical protein